MYMACIFDFDGTIGDTENCVFATLKAVFNEHGLPEPAESAIKKLLGLPLEQVVSELIAAEHKADFYQQIAAEYRGLYPTLLANNTWLFPGMKDLLKKLHGQGIVCTIATSKRTRLAELSCDHLGIRHYFQQIVGEEMVSAHKPDPEVVLFTLDKIQMHPEQVVMIGDSKYDMLAAKAAGIDRIAVTWGVHDYDTLQSTEPTAIVDSAQQLADLITAS